MKRVIARLIIALFLIASITSITWGTIIYPCIEIGNKYGVHGIFTYLFIIGIITIAIYFLIKLFAWAIDNAINIKLIWIRLSGRVITVKEALKLNLVFFINIHGEYINKLDCRSIWIDEKGNTYRVVELCYSWK